MIKESIKKLTSKGVWVSTHENMFQRTYYRDGVWVHSEIHITFGSIPNNDGYTYTSKLFNRRQEGEQIFMIEE